ILERCLPALLEAGAAFKVASSLVMLDCLNHGDLGLSQVGKFITVYPNEDVHAVELARVLRAATRGLRGPAARCDRRSTTDSPVHYRYGSFGHEFVQTPLGAVVPALAGP